MTKHILFVLTSFGHGGITQSLRNFLTVIDKDLLDIDVFVIDHYGPYKDLFSNCKVLPQYKLLRLLYGHFDTFEGTEITARLIWSHNAYFS